MKFKNFLDKFPPPEYLDVPYNAIVFSDSNIRVLSLERGSMHPTLYLELPIEEGAIELGKIKNEEAISKVLSSFTSKLKTPFVKFAFPDEISYSFSAEVPVTPGKDAAESVSFIMEENVPLPLTDISFDFTPTKVSKKEQATFANVVVTAASASIIDEYIKVLRKNGLEPLFATNESQAIAKSVVPRGERGNSAIIYVHRHIVGIYMTEGQLVEFSSVLQIPPDSSPELFTSFVVAEIKKALDYWKENRAIVGDIKCLLCGRHDMCKLILAGIEKSSLAPATLSNVWVNAFSLENYIPNISFEDSLRFGGAVGLLVE